MKNYKIKLLLVLIGVWSINSFAQVKELNDPSIVAQHKRMVYDGWGDFRPNPKYVLGIQTNFAYATVWGWLAPSKNREYKEGADIRPLKPTGLEVQRFVEMEVQRRESEKIKIAVDSLYTRNMQDFTHWTSATAEADPLWLLYYNRMLKTLKNFPDRPQNFLEWGLKDASTYQNMLATGGITNLQRELDLIKDQYQNSRTLDMPRGKRFLMYHDTLLKWRKFNDQLRGLTQKNTLFLDYKKLLEKKSIAIKLETAADDAYIVQKIMHQYKNKF